MTLTIRITTPSKPERREVAGASTPTARSLKRHGERYGWEGVAEIAAEYGISLMIPKPEKDETKPKRGPSLKKRIQEYLERELSWTAIAELENLSPRRARELETKYGKKA